mgnify:CR=1 FL=1
MRTGGLALEPVEVAKKAVEVASDKRANDILLLDISKVCSCADYFVILNCEAERQMDAISDEMDNSLGQEGIRLRRREGTTDSGWVLLDFGEVIVHIFTPEQRAHYNLDKLWSKASIVVRVQ